MSQRKLTLVSGKSSFDALLDLPTPLPSSLSALVLTHGAGGDMNLDSIAELSQYLASQGIACLRFTCSSSLGVRVKVFKAAIDYLSAFKDTNISSIFLAGRSMGSRAALQTTTELEASQKLVKGCVCLAYPLRNPASAPPRIELLQAATLPALFISGTKDPMCNTTELTGILKGLSISTKFVTLEGGDHSFKAKKSGTYTYAELKQQQNEEVVAWLKTQGVVADKKAAAKRAREDDGEKDTPASPSKKPRQATMTKFLKK